MYAAIILATRGRDFKVVVENLMLCRVSQTSFGKYCLDNANSRLEQYHLLKREIDAGNRPKRVIS